MTLLRASLLLCAWLCFATAATDPARVHEARQGPISTIPSGTLSRTTSSTSTNPETTMSPTPSSEPSSPASSPELTSDSHTPTPPSILPMPPSTSSNAPLSPLYLDDSSSSGSSASSPSSATSSAAPQPSSSQPSLNFTVRNMTTCTSGLISWKYTAKGAADLFLSITNIGVDQYYALPRVRARQNTIDTAVMQQLVDTNTNVSSWTWPSVNVTQGWYQIQGLVLASPTVLNNSGSFFVSNGTDVTCLTSTSPQGSSTASPGSGASTPSGASKSNVASIAGGVVGGVVGVALIVLAGVWLWARRRRRRFPLGSRGEDRKWGSLKSTASSIHPGSNGAQLTGNRFHAHSESTGAIIPVAAGGKASSPTTPDGSEEDVATTGEEKLMSPISSSGMSPVDVLNTPIRYDRRTSIQSLQTPTSAASDPFRPRAGSTHTPNQTLEQQAQRIRSSMETSTRRRSERLSMPTLPSPGLSRLIQSPTHSQPSEEYPLSPVTATPVNRSISTGAVSTTMSARRASRKPVPHYDPSVLLEDTSTSTNTDSISMFTAGAESSSQSHGTGKGAGAYGTPPDLLHKASFADGRPMHYLIPDMPPPQQD